MQFVEIDDHLDDIGKEWEGKFVVKNWNSSCSLGLFDAKSAQFVEGEIISPPVRPIFSSILSSLISSRKFGFISDIGNPCEVRVMHNQ